MAVPLMMLLGFAAWTLLLLLFTVGVYRWARILTGRIPEGGFPADRVEGEEWYRRSMRAHANCIENLPVYTAIVLAASAAHVDDALLDWLAVVLLVARVIQSSIHVSFVQTNRAVSFRFSFFMVQFVCMTVMGIHVALAA